VSQVFPNAGLPGRRTDARQLGALALSHAQQGRLDRAVLLLRQAIAVDPGIAELHNNLGMTLYNMQRTQEAVGAYRAALDLRPDYSMALNNLGVALAALGSHQEAIAAYQKALAVVPGYAEALNNLGASLHAVERSAEAAGYFREALKLRSEFTEVKVNLGHALSALGRPAEAVPCYQEVLGARPLDATAHVDLAGALRESGRTVEAVELYQKAVALAPDLAAAHAGLGLALLELGRADEARRSHYTAFRLEPGRAGHLLGLALSTKLTPEHPDLGSILGLSDIVEQLDAVDKIDAHFALAKALSDIGEQERSFAHQLAGNALKRARTAYDEAGRLRQLQRIREVFTADVIGQFHDRGNGTCLPVFIVGMPRSGSTLVEQILASHSQVFGAGELDAFSDAVTAAGLQTQQSPFPETVLRVPDGQLIRTAEEYLSRLARAAAEPGRSPQVLRITDKMLLNFRFLGLIHMLLPNARIVHIRRDPIDTCLSCFSIQFAKLPFTYDLGELGRFYVAYETLMAHWRAVLPPGRMLEVQYEELVNDFEPVARGILDYCGLEWEETCLRFHETERPVRTASVAQVRQPLYRHAVGRWRPEPTLLRPLIGELQAMSGQ
jgi:tetratricopeptide (TPR) repeat protein